MSIKKPSADAVGPRASATLRPAGASSAVDPAPFGTLPPALRVYSVLTILAGMIAAAAVVMFPPTPGVRLEPTLLLGLVMAGIVFSTWRAELPIQYSAMTITSAVVALGVMLQGAIGAVICAAAGALVGTILRPAARSWVPRFVWEDFRPLFNLGLCVLAAAGAAYAYAGVRAGMGAGDVSGLLPTAVGVLAFQSVYFFFNTIGVAVALALDEPQNVVELWRVNYSWTWPGYMASGLIALGVYSVCSLLPVHVVPFVAGVLILTPLYFIYYAYRAYIDRMNVQVEKMEQDMRLIKELNDLNSAILTSLAMAIDAKDRYTRTHINRVQIYSVALAEAVGMSGAELEAVRTAALVHDIGKLGIPERILGKPGKLTPDEFRRMQAHVTIGAEILAPVPFPWPVLPIVLTHHERWDGLGYPKNLKGDEIPVGGRILAIADVFDALTSNRPYRRAMTLDEAIAVLREAARKQFDPDLVEKFAEVLPEAHRRVVAMEAQDEGVGSDDGAAEGEPNWALTQITQASAEMTAACELAQGLAETTSIQEVLSVVLDRALRFLPADTAVIYLSEDSGGELRAEGVSGLYAERLHGLTIHRGEGVAGWVAETLQPQVNAQASLDVARRFTPNQNMDLSSATAVPLVQGGATVGVLALYTRAYSVLGEQHLGVLNILGEHAAAAIMNARRYELTRELSLTDALTALPNSRCLIHHIETLCSPWAGVSKNRIPDQFTVLMFDLDAFKAVNDTLGHLRGDDLLRAFAQVLREMSRDHDLPCRYAGDEFVVVLSGANEEQAGHFARRVREALDAHTAGWAPRPQGVSVGAACFPEDGTDVRSLLAVADQRMYDDKFSRRAAAPRE